MNNSKLITFVAIVIPVLAVMLAARFLGFPVFERIVTLLFINMILVLGLQAFMGNSGILSFAHIAFMGIGAYTSSLFTIPLQMRGMVLPDLYPVLKPILLSPYAAIAVGAVAAMLVAALVAYPLMRLSDAAAVITSFALLVVMHTIMVNWSEVTNGPRTLFGVPKATTIYLAAAGAILAALIALYFKESRTGLLLRAVRDDEVAAGAMGANLSLLRWKGFVLSALLAGFAGGLWAHFITSYQPSAFYLKETFVILGMLVIGGAGTVSGAVLGTFVVTFAFEALRATENALNSSSVFPWQLVGLTEIVLALAMIAVLALRPGGLIEAEEFGATWRKLRRRG
ncbi:branched-chain amino acid ABC transporter permease [Microbaculum marinisediminis]|uniref:Branched-chain amino acid ABC transporter permease n=1 Tax=Microbaculum marinisediminis TaxID=2931392 RepID=A0AAW5R4C2_9HYPH|nr:branched-chain amino acid ABC transporter permease [Microbaculum sp. A6E488]MCT8974634.1 branched-chain amino acid ABC transporter permease [Microbaculum sp. A6E488]